MKTVACIFFTFYVFFSFGQTSPKLLSFDEYSISHTVKKNSLNINFFKLNDFKIKTNSLTELFLWELNKQELKPLNNMRYNIPQGKFFQEIYQVEDDIDGKTKIFDLEKSKYYLRNLG